MELGRIAQIRSGSVFVRVGADALDDSAPYVQAGDLTGPSFHTAELSLGPPPTRAGGDASLRANDIVIGLRGVRNNARVMPDSVEQDGPVFATLDVGVIRIDTIAEPGFIAWYLNLPSTQIALSEHRSGSAAPRLPLSALKDLEIPLPSLARQRAIVAVADLSAREQQLFQALIEARSRLAEELLRQAAEEGSAPGCTPARTDHRLGGHSSANQAFSNRQTGDTKMANTTNGRKGGTTHVVPAPSGGWNVKRGGAARASSHHDTKAEAEAAGRKLSRNVESELKIHKLNGRIAQSDSHGNDPRSTKG